MKFPFRLVIISFSLVLFQYSLLAQDFKIVFTSKDLVFKNASTWKFSNQLTDDWQNSFCSEDAGFYNCIIKTKKPEIISLINTQLLAMPGKTIHGALNSSGDVFKISDSNNINQLIINFENRLQKTSLQYYKNTTFDKFLVLADSLEKYITRTLRLISQTEIKKRYGISDDINSAITQLFITRLAHFYVLPILIKADYQFDKITELVKKNIKITNAGYWLQVQSGRVFLRVFFNKQLITSINTDLYGLFNKESLFRDTIIRKYTAYQYFFNLINGDTGSVNAGVILKKLNEFENKYSFSVSEKKIIETLKTKFNLLNKNILPLFNKEQLSNYSGKIIGEEAQDTLLKNQGKVILYYWASWCEPCLATINKLNSDEINYIGNHYKIIFISIDDNKKRWQSVHKKVLKPSNSFLISKLTDDSFYFFFKIWHEIPRLFLIDNGILINQNFSREEFYKIFKL